MTEGDFKDKMNRFMDAFGEVLDGYEKANPEWLRITFSQIIYRATESLKGLVENPEEKDITWENPLVELWYPVKANWEKVEPYYFDIKAEDLGGLDRIKEKMTEAFITVKEVFVLRKITREILIIFKNGKGFYRLPLSLDKKLVRLSKKERLARIEKILKPIRKVNRIRLYDLPLAGKKRAKAYFAFQFNPCVLDVDEKRAYYPVVIGLEFRGLQPKDMDEETRASIWTGLLKGIEKALPEESLDYLKRPGPEPIGRPVTKEAPLVRAGLHVELQKFGHKPLAKQLGLFDALLDETQKDVTEKSLEVIGLDFTESQNTALFAIQKLLNETNYKGNILGQDVDSKPFRFKGFLPALEFAPAKYLEAFGVTKIRTARGYEEYSGEERRQALRALVDLTKPFLFVYKRKYFRGEGNKRELVTDRIEKIAPLIQIIRGYEALTKKEDASLDKGTATKATDEKLKAIAIEPAPILVQDIDSYYVLKPANCYQEIKFKCPHASKFVYRLIDWLMTQAELKRRKNAPLIIEESLEEIAYHLRMEAYLKTRQLKRIKQIINKCYATAKDLGYLLSYGTVQGRTKKLEHLELNPDKFKWARKVEKERAKLGGPETSH